MIRYGLFQRISSLVEHRKIFLIVAYMCKFMGLLSIAVQPMLLAYLIDHVLIGGEEGKLIPIIIICAALITFGFIMNIVSSGIFRNLDIRYTLDIREKIIQHIRKIPVDIIEKNGVGKYTALVGMDPAVVAQFLTNILVEVVSQYVTLLFALIFLFSINWVLGVVALLSVPFIIILPMLFRKPLIRYSQQIRSHNEEVGAMIIEHIEGSREIRVFGLEKWEKNKNKKVYSHLIKSSTLETIYGMLSSQVGSLSVSFIILTVYYYSSGQILHGTMTLGGMVASVGYLSNVLTPVLAAASLYSSVMKSEVAISRIEEFLGMPVETYQNNKYILEMKERNLGTKEPILSVNDLNVPGEAKPILKNIDFHVSTGQMIALVGPSGSGKTTLLKTLMGLISYETGSIHLNNRLIGDLSREEINLTIGMAFQEAYLFKGTLFENIKLAKLEATEEEVVEASRMANLGTLISDLPNGIHTELDPNGGHFSGGERQRIALARLFLRKPPIILLDEPTSAVDSMTEMEIFKSIKHLQRECTIILSTHRLDSIMDFDCIYLLKDGEVVEKGNYQQLINQRGGFYSMVAKERETVEMI
ncbi:MULTISPECIES: ABC transporter ATP-binding protein [Paenibacillus]|uniref:ABC transporter ATP-binding protein n=1 Tax=Paenibacillus cucumis (ex Kampfer et al. 2016) TaxID=1776858 RepID=A0ABS7KSG6_9BACL|nr:ABC transporter ATP-binding protein [Paenibacillus cucumis (ex Kampfer et al. 2016)]MBY0207112.1 ABC transporter ATP-binding protein [Paenibacillus cucumis (ex Kampfer et al. 2016)]MDP9698988.1 ABC-type multidrug transport system fused ATPase/permease subunit [Paenibacillus intestini]